MNENLKKELKLLLQEHAMFNNTLAEMVEKNSSVYAIKQIEDEISSLDKKIKSVQEEIRVNSQKECENKEELRKSFYEEIKKPSIPKSFRHKKTNKKNLYDSIKKSDFATYDTPYHSLGKEEVYDSNKFSVYTSGTPLTPYDNVNSANRFLVRFGTPFNIQEYYVRSVNFSPSDRKELFITLFDFITDDNKPIIAELNGQNIPFRISIDHLDPTGVVLYTERYHGCRIMETMKSDLDYSSDEKSTIKLRIEYSDLTYEASK